VLCPDCREVLSQRRRSVLISGASNLMNTLRRIGLWAGSLILSVTLFSLLFSLLPNWGGAIFLIFRVTMLFALPVWCLYLPFVIALKDAEERRIWTTLFSGILIGPASLSLWGFILQLGGGDPHKIWQGDPLIGFGLNVGMIFALIVGFLTTSFYVIALMTPTSAARYGAGDCVRRRSQRPSYRERTAP
jgi:hypothetical protein